MKRVLVAALIALAPLCALATQQQINVGTSANDGTGDSLRTAFGKVNANTSELYALVGGKQPFSTTLTGLAAVSPNADQVIYATGGGTFAATSLPAFARGLIGSASAVVARTTLGLGGAAILNVGATTGTVADGGALTAETARATAAEQANATAISNETTRATAAEATKAAKGANADITSLAGLTTPLSGPQGGTGYVGVSAALDGLFSSTQGAVLYRGPAGWQGLAPGTAGQVLTTGGAGANPSWTSVSSGTSTVMQPQGRLTLASGTPVLASAVSAATSVLYTPAVGNLVPLWNGSAFVMTACAETAQALSDTTKSPSAAAASQVYDYFAWSDAGTCRVTRGPAWSAGTSGSNTARGTGAGSTALNRVNGLLTNSVAITNGPAAGYGVYVGTIMTDAGGATVTFNPGSSAANGGAAWIGLWNAFNRARIVANVRDATASWTDQDPAWRAAHASTSNRATFVLGLAEEPITATYAVRISTAGANGVAQTSIGLDSTGTPSPLATMTLAQSGGSFIQASPVATFAGFPGIGAHFLQALEAGDGSTTTTFSGNGYQSLVVDGRF